MVRIDILKQYKISLVGWQSFIVIVLVINVTMIEHSHYITSSYAHLAGARVQTWLNTKDNIKIQFIYYPEKPIIDTFTSLNFSVQDLKTGEHLKDFIGRVVVTNGQRLFKFENITVPNGDFGVKYLFPDDGTHQVILRIHSKNLFELASFQVFVPHQSPPGLLSSGGDVVNIIIVTGLIAAVGLVMILILKKR